MTSDLSKSSPRGAIAFVFYLVPEFSMYTLSSALEALRLANRLLGYEAYSWRMVSEDGEPVLANCGLLFRVTSSLANERRLLEARRQYMTIVCAEDRIETHTNKALEAWLRDCKKRGIVLGALGTGTYVLANAGLLANKRCTIHWEMQPSFAERFKTVDLDASIYTSDGDIWTCAGGAASYDMMLSIVERDFGVAAAASICEYAVVEHARAAESRQRIPISRRLGLQNQSIIRAIEQMEQNIAEPISISTVASRISLSRRQIERLFRQELNRSPVNYYRELRLDRARLLLMQSEMQVIDVAIACGFVSTSHFSKVFRDAFGMAPRDARGERKAAWRIGETGMRPGVASTDARSHRFAKAA
ncbi:GlxA family transcriptional regulator [Rhizobium sp. NXC24]|uniref:GlxA family transcriptional regulator n=1 Tax=Rhizobium sp. NXC24 TaxID=2048897 RepID=UPI000CDF548A|nr:GlxA family transcriptional regulator [Rhizobium sp. NXC24]AVA21315.1 AraC family transcriptional regulator protein [Rhizobium sp. NXC24]